MKIKIVLFLIICSILNFCIPKKTNTPVCTEDARAGLNMYVKVFKTNVFLSDSVMVTATDGAYTETLMPFGSTPPNFTGAFERPGNYILNATKMGYQTFTSTPIVVNKDECHVIVQTYTITLNPK